MSSSCQSRTKLIKKIYQTQVKIWSKLSSLLKLEIHTWRTRHRLWLGWLLLSRCWWPCSRSLRWQRLDFSAKKWKRIWPQWIRRAEEGLATWKHSWRPIAQNRKRPAEGQRSILEFRTTELWECLSWMPNTVKWQVCSLSFVWCRGRSDQTIWFRKPKRRWQCQGWKQLERHQFLRLDFQKALKNDLLFC